MYICFNVQDRISLIDKDHELMQALKTERNELFINNNLKISTESQLVLKKYVN